MVWMIVCSVCFEIIVVELTVQSGHNHLLEIRLLETSFLSRFQPNPKLRCLVLDNFQKKNLQENKYFVFRLGYVCELARRS